MLGVWCLVFGGVYVLVSDGVHDLVFGWLYVVVFGGGTIIFLGDSICHEETYIHIPILQMFISCFCSYFRKIFIINQRGHPSAQNKLLNVRASLECCEIPVWRL